MLYGTIWKQKRNQIQPKSFTYQVKFWYFSYATSITITHTVNYPVLPMVITFLTFQQNSLSNIRKQNWFVIWSLVNYKFLGNIQQNMARRKVHTIPSFRVRSGHVSWVCLNISMFFLPTSLARNKFCSFSSFPLFILKPCTLPFLYRRPTEVWGKQKRYTETWTYLKAKPLTRFSISKYECYIK